VDTNTNRLLDLFAQTGVKATFFTLGWVAVRHALMRRIVAEGHELASHGWAMRACSRWAPMALRRHCRCAQGAGGCRRRAFMGYRAPSFSIDQRTPGRTKRWRARAMLYSSSVPPSRMTIMAGAAPRFAFRPVDGADLIEIPVTTVQVAGGAWRRAAAAFSACCPMPSANGRCAASTGRMAPGHHLFPPWEIDPASRAWSRAALAPAALYE
jgi:peptidoglycan/xylan/chitin deacetylase (PgdA/CDA1 family)